jgi:RNA polymerase sigma-70 factor (ECF subfamily)
MDLAYAQSLGPAREPALKAMPDAAAELVARARGGDRSAFGALYELHAPWVHAVLLGLVSPGEAQDLVQDVFVAALGRLEQLQDGARFGPWIAAIARNRGRDALRARGRAGSLMDRGDGGDMGDAGAGEPAAPERGDGEDAEAQRALDAIRELPEAYRETLLMRLVEGLKGPEIARRTGLTHGSVRVNLCRGMKLLRARLAGEEA